MNTTSFIISNLLKMKEKKSQVEFASVTGSLMSALNCMHPAIAYTVNKSSRYTSNHICE